MKPHFMDTCFMWKTHYYRQFSLSLRKESSYNFSKFNPLNTDTPSIPLLQVNETSNIFSPTAKGKLINHPLEKRTKQKLQKKYPLWVGWGGGVRLYMCCPNGMLFLCHFGMKRGIAFAHFVWNQVWFNGGNYRSV